MHANIKSDNSASHHSQRQKSIHMLREHLTLRKEQHSIITQFQTVSVHCFDYILLVVQCNAFSKPTILLTPKGPHPERATGLPLQLYSHCQCWGRCYRYSGDLKLSVDEGRQTDIKTKWTPTTSMSTHNTAQTVWIHPEIIPDQSVCLCVRMWHVWHVFSRVYIHLGLLVCVRDTQSDFNVLRHDNTLTYTT